MLYVLLFVDGWNVMIVGFPSWHRAGVDKLMTFCELVNICGGPGKLLDLGLYTVVAIWLKHPIFSTFQTLSLYN